MASPIASLALLQARGEFDDEPNGAFDVLEVHHLARSMHVAQGGC